MSKTPNAILARKVASKVRLSSFDGGGVSEPVLIRVLDGIARARGGLVVDRHEVAKLSGVSPAKTSQALTQLQQGGVVKWERINTYKLCHPPL